MNKSWRLASMIVILLVITLLSLSGAAWANPAQQGTVPGCVSTVEATAPASGQTATLTVCSGMAVIPFRAFPTGGKAVVEEKTQADMSQLGRLPTGLSFLGNGLNVSIFTSDGKLVRFFSGSVKVCFPRPADNRVILIRYWDAKLDRWIPYPTFRENGLACTRTRLPGIYAPIGR